MTDCIHGIPISKGLIEGCPECDEEAQRIADKTKPKPRMKDIEILTQLERLAASFPWDTVCIKIERTPEGKMDFTPMVSRNEKFGFPFDCGFGSDLNTAVERLIQGQEGKRDPETAKEKKIAELKEQIAKLQQVVLGVPPYKPNKELAQFVNPTIEV